METDVQNLRIGYLGSADHAFGRYFLKDLHRMPIKSLDYLELRQELFLIPFQDPDFILQFVINGKRIWNNLIYYVRYFTLRRYCKRNNISFTAYKSITDPRMRKRIAELDVILTAGLRQTIPKSIYTSLPYGIINFHYSLLPKYRGTMPLFWQAVNHDFHYGFSFHRINSQIDAGQLLFQKEVEVDGSYTFGALGDLLTKVASQYLREVFQNVENGVALDIHTPCKRNEDYLDYIHIDIHSFSERLLIKSKVTPVFIWDKRFYFKVKNCYSTMLEDMVRISNSGLQLIRNGILVNVDSINYIPAIYYYRTFRSLWREG